MKRLTPCSAPRVVHALALLLPPFVATDGGELRAALPPTPPQVRILQPADGTVVEEFVQIIAEATDVDGYVYRVDFFAGTNLIQSVQPGPFFTYFEPGPGRYELKALAIDNSGRRTLSAPVRIQVGTDLPDRLLRGPYLQMATPNSMVVRWRSDWFTVGVVRYWPQSGGGPRHRVQFQPLHRSCHPPQTAPARDRL